MSKGHGKGRASHFQIKLGGDWKDYSPEEDKILKRAFGSGQKKANFALRGQTYEYDFTRMEQLNKGTGRTREIRPPHGWRAPAKAIVPPGPTMAVTIPNKTPLPKSIKVPHPQAPSQFIVVKLPKGAKPGKEMLIPIPPVEAMSADPAKPKGGGGQSSAAGVATAAAAGVGVVAVVGGAVVAGAIIAGEDPEDLLEGAGEVAADAGEAIADAIEDAGIDDFAEDAAEAIVDAAEDATEWLAGAGDDAGDFIMDLF